MRKAFGAALCAALAGGLALAAISGGATTRASVATLDGAADTRAVAHRATDTYKGKFNGTRRARIKIKARVRGGEVKAIESMSYKRLPANCSVTEPPPPVTIGGSWSLRGVRVNDRRKFKVVGQDDNHPTTPSALRFSGRFSADFDKVKGKFQTRSYFPPSNPPEETCTSFTKRYGAKR